MATIQTFTCRVAGKVYEAAGETRGPGWYASLVAEAAYPAEAQTRAYMSLAAGLRRDREWTLVPAFFAGAERAAVSAECAPRATTFFRGAT